LSAGRSTATGIGLEAKTGSREVTYNVASPLTVATNLTQAWTVGAGAPTTIKLTQQPSGRTPGVTFVNGATIYKSPIVALADAYGNTVTSGSALSSNVSIAISSDTGTMTSQSKSITTSGNGSVSADSVAFSGNAALPHKMKFVATGGLSATIYSEPFFLSHGAAAKLEFAPEVSLQAGLREMVYDFGTYFEESNSAQDLALTTGVGK
jgi:hypothetical protein